MQVDARRFIYYVTISDCVQLAVGWLQDVATRHGRGVVVTQLVIGLLPLCDALCHVTVMAVPSKDHSDVAKVRDGVIFPEECLDLLVGRLVDTFNRSE